VTDLRDPDVRHAVTDRLGALWAGRPVVVGPMVLAGAAPYVAWFRELGCPVLVVATSRGAGRVPADDDCQVVTVAPPATASVTEELRTYDRMTRHLPDHARTAVEAFDPERRATWFTLPFVTTDDPVDGRPVTGGRPASFVALEDKLLADPIWDAAGVERAPCRVVEVGDDAGLRAAAGELGGPAGTVWSGDARDGFNGGGNFVRWVRDESDRTEALAFFRPRCDRVRVAPFLEGVPCSVHGFVLPGGTAALRPVEIVVLRDPATRAFRYSGLGTTWDPPAADREVMRSAAHRVGALLQREHGYRGAFGIDGVLTEDGFRPTELNTRMSAGATTVADVDRRFFTFLQAALVAGVDTGLTSADVEGLVPEMDAHRTGKVICVCEGTTVEDDSYPVAWDGASFSRAEADTGDVFAIGATPTGLFAKVDPCTAVVAGRRLAPVSAALAAYVHATYGAGSGTLEPAPDVRAAS
jgi:hypothetical protein